MSYVCCICNKVFDDWGNDPAPIVMDEDAKCCNECDMAVVLPARLKALQTQIKPNKTKRVEMLRAMSTIVRNVNNEEIVEGWLMTGIADGDEELDDDRLFEDYGDDETFADVMSSFVRTMRRMVDDEDFSKQDRHNGDGYLFCDGVTSKFRWGD